MSTIRTCGECTLCCKTHGIRELVKPSGVWCVHCAVGKGCTVYARRPQSCQEFECAWLTGFFRPKHRPDKTQVVPEFRAINIFGLTLFLWAASNDALDSEFVRRRTHDVLQAGQPVIHVPIQGNPKLYLPRGKKCEIAFRFGDMSFREVEIVPFLEGRF